MNYLAWFLLTLSAGQTLSRVICAFLLSPSPSGGFLLSSGYTITSFRGERTPSTIRKLNKKKKKKILCNTLTELYCLAASKREDEAFCPFFHDFFRFSVHENIISFGYGTFYFTTGVRPLPRLKKLTKQKKFTYKTSINILKPFNKKEAFLHLYHRCMIFSHCWRQTFLQNNRSVWSQDFNSDPAPLEPEQWDAIIMEKIYYKLISSPCAWRRRSRLD